MGWRRHTSNTNSVVLDIYLGCIDFRTLPIMERRSQRWEKSSQVRILGGIRNVIWYHIVRIQNEGRFQWTFSMARVCYVMCVLF